MYQQIKEIKDELKNMNISIEKLAPEQKSITLDRP